MPDVPSCPLLAATSAFNCAYAALPPHVRALPSRLQSREILRLAAMACTQIPLAELDDDGDARLVASLAHLANSSSSRPSSLRRMPLVAMTISQLPGPIRWPAAASVRSSRRSAIPGARPGSA
jgi:hypothetical protein